MKGVKAGSILEWPVQLKQSGLSWLIPDTQTCRCPTAIDLNVNWVLEYLLQMRDKITS